MLALIVGGCNVDLGIKTYRRPLRSWTGIRGICYTEGDRLRGFHRAGVLGIHEQDSEPGTVGTEETLPKTKSSANDLH